MNATTTIDIPTSRTLALVLEPSAATSPCPASHRTMRRTGRFATDPPPSEGGDA